MQSAWVPGSTGRWVPVRIGARVPTLVPGCWVEEMAEFTGRAGGVVHVQLKVVHIQLCGHTQTLLDDIIALLL